MPPPLLIGYLGALGLGVSVIVACQSPQSHSSRFVPVVKARSLEGLSQAERHGYLIFVQDRAAWRGTDAVLALGPPELSPSVAGWLTIGEGANQRVSFVGEGERGPVALVDVIVDLTSPNPDVAEVLNPPRPLDHTELAMWGARRTAIQAEFRACSDRYNTAILPGSDGTWLVYLLAASTDPETIQVLGHHVMTVSADGEKLLSAQSLSRSCMAIEREQGAAAMWVTHTLSDEPTATHVFTCLAEMTLWVGTESASWKIEDGYIERVARDEAPRMEQSLPNLR